MATSPYLDAPTVLSRTPPGQQAYKRPSMTPPPPTMYKPKHAIPWREIILLTHPHATHPNSISRQTTAARIA